MTAPEILAQVTTIMRDVLDNEAIQVTPETTAKQVPEWDSLSHVQLVVAIEKHFKIRFTARELSGFRNVGEMCAGIGKRLAG
jgi:acyl carrier protein